MNNNFRCAIFIDGGYLDQVLLQNGKARIDYGELCDYARQGVPLLRAYYYHCLPYQSSTPTEIQREEFSKAERFQRILSRLDRITVRRGKLAYRGVDDKGKASFEQKRVDVYLATDLVMHSTKRLITHAILITGDSDFIPAIDISQSEGVHITLLYSDLAKPHDELLDAVDERKQISPEDIKSWERKKRK